MSLPLWPAPHPSRLRFQIGRAGTADLGAGVLGQVWPGGDPSLWSPLSSVGLELLIEAWKLVLPRLAETRAKLLSISHQPPFSQLGNWKNNCAFLKGLAFEKECSQSLASPTVDELLTVGVTLDGGSSV